MILAGRTGLEPAASGVTGRRYNQLNYRPKAIPIFKLLLSRLVLSSNPSGRDRA